MTRRGGGFTRSGGLGYHDPMRKPRLALRVTLNSVAMIFSVYLVMQFVSYFRDNILFGIAGFSALPRAVLGFMAANVLPPTLFFAAILYFLALPLQRVEARLAAGEELPPEELEATRKRILGFAKVVLAMNLVGFAAGYVLFLVSRGQASLLLRLDKLVILVSNLAGGAVYAAAQSALDGVAFAPLRDRLGIREIGVRRREATSTRRQVEIGILCAVYVLTFLQFNLRDLSDFHEAELGVLASIRSGALPPDEAAGAYREALAGLLGSLTGRPGLDAAAIPLPWERGRSFASVQQGIFALYFAFLCAVVAGAQLAIAHERRRGIDAIRGRLREVVAGEGDLRGRLALRSMDDFGELTELINRLLDEFARVVGRIAAEVSRTRAGADETALVVAEAMEKAGGAAGALVALKDEIEAEAARSRCLRESLAEFRGAAAKVSEAAEAQEGSVADSSAAIEEMAASIGSVEEMTRRAGELATSLAGQGEEGGRAAAETVAAIREIEAASALILQATGALGKISSSINLLSMNASIEAAHAGDQGRGFAVVADEVRKLASNAARETASIKQQIAAMAVKVAEGVRRSESSGEMLARLATGLADSASISREVAQAMGEEAEGTRAVASSVSLVAEASHSIRGRMAEQEERIRAMSEALEATLRRLESLAEVSRRQAEGVESLRRSFDSVSRGVAANRESVQGLEAGIGRFKL